MSQKQNEARIRNFNKLRLLGTIATCGNLKRQFTYVDSSACQNLHRAQSMILRALKRLYGVKRCKSCNCPIMPTQTLCEYCDFKNWYY